MHYHRTVALFSLCSSPWLDKAANAVDLWQICSSERGQKRVKSVQAFSSTSADVVLAAVFGVGVHTHLLGMGKGGGSLHCLKWCYTSPGQRV